MAPAFDESYNFIEIRDCVPHSGTRVGFGRWRMLGLAKRVGFLATAAIVAAGCGSVSSGAGVSAPTIQIKYSTQWGPTFPAVRADQYFADQINKQSNGRIKVTIYLNGQLGGAPGTVTGVENGTIQMGVVATSWLSSISPHAPALSTPFLFKDEASAERALKGPAGALIGTEAENYGHVLLTSWYPTGFGQFSTTTHPINSLADMRGLKMRVLNDPTEIASYKAWGAIPLPLNNTEVFAALQSGTAQGVGIPISAMMNDKYGEVVKYISVGNVEYFASVVMINAAFFNSLPSDLQQLLMKVGAEAGAKEAGFVANADADATKTAESMGIKVNQIPDSALGDFKSALSGVYANANQKYGAGFMQNLSNS